MSTLDGDTPCTDCGIDHNIVWFTDNVLWNHVCVEDNPILCVKCFVRRVEEVGYRPASWRLLPEWPMAGTPTEEHLQKVVAKHEAWVRGE